ncbi:hypothetical protein NKH16_25100 [Mesorhizobium sp. M1307]
MKIDALLIVCRIGQGHALGRAIDGVLMRVVHLDRLVERPMIARRGEANS